MTSGKQGEGGRLVLNIQDRESKMILNICDSQSPGKQAKKKGNIMKRHFLYHRCVELTQTEMTAW